MAGPENGTMKNPNVILVLLEFTVSGKRNTVFQWPHTIISKNAYVAGLIVSFQNPCLPGTS